MMFTRATLKGLASTRNHWSNSLVPSRPSTSTYSFSYVSIYKQQTRALSKTTVRTRKTRPHSGGNIVSYDAVRSWQNAATLLPSARTQEMFWKVFRNIPLCPPRMLRAWQNDSTLQETCSLQQWCRNNVAAFYEGLRPRSNNKSESSSLIKILIRFHTPTIKRHLSLIDSEVKFWTCSQSMTMHENGWTYQSLGDEKTV